MTMTIDDVYNVIGRIEYKESWKILVLWDESEREYLHFRWTFERPDRDTKKVQAGYGPWFHVLSSELDEESLVRRLFQAALQVEEHECREHFIYNGERPMNPHTRLITPIAQ